MQKSYTIEVSIKTIKGYVSFCQYQLGGIAEDAERIFACMKGRPVDEEGCAPFLINLVLRSGKKTATLASQYCSLTELKENCHYIAREVFKILNLE
jgi:hypothetical protein